MDSEKIKVTFHLGAKVEITGGTENEEYEVFFINKKNNKLIHRDVIKTGYWTKPNVKYFVDWKIQVLKNGVGIIHEEELSLDGKDVLVELGNKPIGDVIAWVPYVIEFGKKHNVKLSIQSLHTSLFENSYPDVSFIKMDTVNVEDNDFYASYRISTGFAGELRDTYMSLFNRFEKLLFIPDITIWNKWETPNHPTLVPIQKTASDVLGFEEFKEMRPKFMNPNPQRPIEKKYICISEFASGELKHWNNQVGWKRLIQELKRYGYEIVSISKEKSKLDGVIKRNGDFPLEDRIWYLHHCEFFIGLSSGLSWLAWGCNKKVVLISGITKKTNEFSEDCIRIINETVCHGCFNSEEHADKFSFFKNNLCPENKNWVCSRSISPKMVLDKIKEHNLI
jgi:autotransporter strand-loop-strand O-heptosyltransferase